MCIRDSNVQHSHLPPSSSQPATAKFKSRRTGRSIRLFQWNCRCISTKVIELRRLLDVHDIDVALIQESKLNANNSTPLFPGFTVIRKDRQAGVAGGGLLTIIREGIAFRRIPSATVGNLEMLLTVAGESRTAQREWSALPTGPNNISVVCQMCPVSCEKACRCAPPFDQQEMAVF